MSDDQLVTESRNGAVTVITLDVGRANALGPAKQAAIGAALDRAESDPEVGAIVIAGREGRFRAAFDLNIMGSGDLDAVVSMVDGIFRGPTLAAMDADLGRD